MSSSTPDFKRLLNYSPLDTVVFDAETSLIRTDGTVEKIWCFGWLWWESVDDKLERRIVQMHWPNGITPDSLASLMNNVHTRAKIRGNASDIKLAHLSAILKEKPAAFHNAGFDKKLLDACNIQVPCYHDTMMVTYLTCPPAVMVENVGDEDKLQLYALKELGRRGICRSKDEPPDFTEFTEELLPYNRGDLEATADLVERLLPQIYADKMLLNCYVDIEMPAIEIALVMNRRGVHIPDDNLDKVTIDAELVVEKRLKTLHQYMPVLPNPNKPKTYIREKDPSDCVSFMDNWTWKDLGKLVYVGTKNRQVKYREIIEFNPNSPTHKIFALKRLFNWESPSKTKKGNPKVDKHALTKLQEDIQHPFVESLLEYSRYNKLLNNFLVPWKTNRDKANRIHPAFIAVGTATGRYSSRNPNFQNIPASIKEGIVAEPGNVIVYVDLSQAELRILAYYMALVVGDYQLWNVYARDEDVHNYNMELMELPKDKRVIAKRAIFLKIYKGGAGVFAQSCDISLAKAKYYLNKFDEVVPGIARLEQAVSAAIMQSKDGVIRTLGGRCIVYPQYQRYYNSYKYKYKKERAFRQYFNAIFQGGNFDITSRLIWEAYPYAVEAGGTPIVQVHDSGVFEVSKASAGWFADKLFSIFNRTDILEGLPIKGMPGIGSSWAEAEKDAKLNEDKAKV